MIDNASFNNYFLIKTQITVVYVSMENMPAAPTIVLLFENFTFFFTYGFGVGRVSSSVALAPPDNALFHA